MCNQCVKEGKMTLEELNQQQENFSFYRNLSHSILDELNKKDVPLEWKCFVAAEMLIKINENDELNIQALVVYLMTKLGVIVIKPGDMAHEIHDNLTKN